MEGRNLGAIVKSLFSTATIYILTEKVGLDLSNWTKCVASVFFFVLPLILPIETYYFRIYAFLSRSFLDFPRGYSLGFGFDKIYRYFRKKLVAYFLGIIDSRITDSTDCVILFRVLSTALEGDDKDDAYEQIVSCTVAEKALEALVKWANTKIEKKEEIIGAAMGLIKWIMQKCAKIRIDKSTNDYSFEYRSDDERALKDFIDKIFDSSRDLYSTLLRHLRSIAAAKTGGTSVGVSENLLESANFTCSFIRMLLEVDRVIPDVGRGISDRISADFESVFMALVERNVSLLLRRAHTGAAARSSRKRSVSRLRCLLRILSLLTLDNARMSAVDAELLTHLKTLNTGLLFAKEDFSDLLLELSNIVSLPETKIFVAANAELGMDYLMVDIARLCDKIQAKDEEIQAKEIQIRKEVSAKEVAINHCAYLMESILTAQEQECLRTKNIIISDDIAEAQYILGQCYGSNDGVLPQDKQAAVVWWKGAAEAGHVSSQYELGMCYYYGGDGVPEDKAHAVRCFMRAATGGHVKAQHCLGSCYYYGESELPRDKNTGIIWWTKAAEGGHNLAQYKLGCHYHGLKGSEQNLEASRMWLSQSAAQGYLEASRKLAEWFP